MRKFTRRLLFGAALAAGFKFLQDKRAEWSVRPAADIRQTVVSNLPEGIDGEIKNRIADKVVEAVKGPQAVTVEDTPPPAQHTTRPDAPDTPTSLRDEI